MQIMLFVHQNYNEYRGDAKVTFHQNKENVANNSDAGDENNY